ncbi:hypothetical protein GCM10009788_46320 [Nocardioides humi]|uniref:Uncharacterized protein n=1 Tax=Nocardioides humi TaxID=449461 RepID=A0ABN2BCV9_9ACTN
MTGLAGATAAGVAVGLLAWPADAGDGQPAFKREQDTPDIVLVADDDDPDDDDLAARAAGDRDTHTNATNTHTRVTHTRATHTRATHTRATNTGDTRSDRTRTGTRSGRDDSRTGRAKADWTRDGGTGLTRDWSRNHTDDRSRHNTRGR